MEINGVSGICGSCCGVDEDSCQQTVRTFTTGFTWLNQTARYTY